jgi:hypothetical protein
MGTSRQSLHAVLRGEAAVTADLVATVRALPFRSDRPFGVRRARRERIAAALFRRDLTFTCHETTEQPVPQHRARALILHETLGRPNWLGNYLRRGAGRWRAVENSVEDRRPACAKVGPICARIPQGRAVNISGNCRCIAPAPMLSGQNRRRGAI